MRSEKPFWTLVIPSASGFRLLVRPMSPEAAVAMVRGGFRHLVVIEDGEIAGLLSMRDVVRCWTQEGATSEMPS